MSKIVQTVLWLSLSLVMSACVAVSHEKLNPEVSGFIQLLVRTDEPTLAECAKFSGECGGEIELDFALKECRFRGWETNSKTCIDFTRQRCHSADQELSFEFSWLRARFSTVGKNYRLIGIRSETVGFRHDLVEVEIGKDKFLLFHNTDPNVPTGLVVGVSKVNGKVVDYLRSQ